MEHNKQLVWFMTTLVLVWAALLVGHSSAAKATYNVLTYGAKGDGKTDSRNGFLRAWTAACSTSNSAIIYVPSGNFFIGAALTFEGVGCKSAAITIRIDGTVTAPSNYNVIGNSGVWLKFHRVNHLTISGGTLDGRGTAYWACVTSGKSCPAGATSLGLYNSNNVVISRLQSVNSQKFHIIVYGCTNTLIKGVSITAPDNSPNTDGIHVMLSTGTTILSSRIGTGDDCISLGPGSSNLWIENVSCGPGHGISIGSLGAAVQEPGVRNVTVKTVIFRGTQNGVRIKTWAKPSNCFVNGVVFQHVTMLNVQNPIIIQQDYCPNGGNCPNQGSGVKISNVLYQDIHGTSATRVAVDLSCSRTMPCNGIRLQDVNLNYKGQAALASCSNAAGTASGILKPSSCLR